MEIRELRTLITEFNHLGRELDRLATTVANEARTATIADVFVREYGEVVTKSRAGEILNLSHPTITAMIERGDLVAAPDNRVVVRSMAEWVSKGKTAKAKALQIKRGTKA